MQPKLLIGVIVALLALGGAYLFFASEAQAPSNGPQAPASEENERQDTEERVTDTSTTTDTQSTNGEDEETTSEPAVTVTYTNDGFSPETVTITRGQTVRFTNESDGDMWVASAVHPTHTVYPEKTEEDCLGSAFDACQSVAPGNSWSFTFNETGEWGYHNHRRANHTGAIVVEEE